MKTHDESNKRSIELSVSKMASSAHSAPRAISEMRSASGALKVVEVPIDIELCRVLEMCLIIIRRPSIHIERRTGRDNSPLINDILNGGARETYRDNDEEAQDLADEGGDVWHLFFNDTFLPCIAVGVDFHDFLIGAGLDFLAVSGGEIGDAHD